MPLLKIHHILSFSSEDPKHTVTEFIKGNGQWLCNCEDKSTSMTAEFQIKKSSIIDYIDIGNSNTFTLMVEVGRSSWPITKKFITLLPAVSLMSLIDCRTENNTKSVKMFKKGDFVQEIIKEKWDRIRLTCSNPYRKKSQFGLQFMKIFNKSDESVDSAVQNPTFEDKNSFMSRMKSHITSPKSKSLVSTNPQLKNLYNYSSRKKISSPNTSRSVQIITASKDIPNLSDAEDNKTILEMEALEFLITLDLTPENINTLKVCHIREEFEFKRKNTLTKAEKSIFKNIALDYAAETLKKHEKSEFENLEEVNLGSQSLNKNRFNFKPKVKNVKGKENFGSAYANESIFPFNNKSPVPTQQKKRNELSLEDCKVTPSSSKKRVKKSYNNSPLVETLDVWLQPNGNKVSKSWMGLPNKSLNSLKKPDSSENSPNFQLIDDNFSDSDEEVQVVSITKKNSLSAFQSQKIGKGPNDKFGTNSKIISSITTPPFELLGVKCPLCTEIFPKNEIETHAATCSLNENLKQAPYQNPKDPIVDFEICPICNILTSTKYYQEHVLYCLGEDSTT